MFRFIANEKMKRSLQDNKAEAVPLHVMSEQHVMERFPLSFVGEGALSERRSLFTYQSLAFTSE
mgnify:CR=1 FL=1